MDMGRLLLIISSGLTVIGLLLIVGLCFVEFVRKYEVQLINIGLLIISLDCILFALCLLDFIASKQIATQDLVFQPETSAQYRTSEFNYISRINRLGFRGLDPVNMDNAPTRKILLIGDSFTYGWGLDYENTWGHILQCALTDSGLDAEVYNCGKPGCNPEEYVSIAQRAIPVLKPDLIILSILQGDDLAQIAYEKMRKASTAPRKSFWERIISQFQHHSRETFPHLYAWISGIGAHGSVSLHRGFTADWKKQGQQILRTLNQDQAKRYATLDPSVRNMFEDGQLNPRLIYDALIVPDRYVRLENVQTLENQRSLAFLANYLNSIAGAARDGGAEVIVVIVPHPAYTCGETMETMRMMTFVVPDSLRWTTNAEEAVKRAADLAGLACYSPVESFRSYTGPPLYFKYDGHFNIAGAAFYADFLVGIVLSYFNNEKFTQGCHIKIPG